MKLTLAIGTTFVAASLTAPGASAQTSARARSATAIATTQASYLGIGVQDIDSERAKTLKLRDERGAEVTSVKEDSPAAKAGIQDGDVILEFNGHPVEGKDQLARLVRETPVGRQVKILIWRNGGAQSVTATMEAGRGIVISGDSPWTVPEMRFPEMPAIEIPRFQVLTQSPMLGIVGESLASQEQLAEFFGVTEGVLVKSVNRSSPAEKAGLKAGDVITKVEDSKVNSTSEITGALRALRSKKVSTVTVTVVRNKKETPITVIIDWAAPGVKAFSLPGKFAKPVLLKKLPYLRPDRAI